jgi:signal transduction histidine kinase
MNAPKWQNVTEIIKKELELQAIPNLNVTLDDADLEILADPLFNRVFTNLIDNTARHGVHATEIHISHQKSAGCLTILYEDNGVGIPVEHKEQIFDQGFGTNTGLGLYLSKEILSGTGIAITETGIPGKGARFEMYVPEHAWRITGQPVEPIVQSGRGSSHPQS